MFAVTELIKSQVYQVIIMFCAGILFMLLYDLVGLLQQRVFTSGFFRVLLELCFWVEAAFITSAFLYYCAYGQLSIHAFCAFVLGLMLWKKIFCGTIKGNG